MSPQPPTLSIPPAGPARILSEDEAHVAALCNRVFVVVWKGEITIPAVAALGEGLRDVSEATRGGRLGTLSVLAAGPPMPTAEARDRAIVIMRELPIAYVAIVYEGTGFAAAAIRGVVTGVALVVGSTLPMRVLATVADAARWAEATAPEYASAPELEAAVSWLRDPRP
jgi:hypothetical protein